MTKRTRIRSAPELEAIADIARAKVDDCIYSASFFATRNISIIDQQLRSFTLCHALSELGIVRNDSRIAIVGAGFSGMTCAVALAMKHNCIVHVFEKDGLLTRFRKAAFRYIHPDLNTREIRSPDIYDLRDVPTKTTAFPFMNWSADYAPAVADELIRKFDHYRSKANIALHRLRVDDVSVNQPVVGSKKPKFRLLVETEYEDMPLPCDLVIMATGFGRERWFSESKDASYWLSGNPQSYVPIAVPSSETGEKVLIVGNGDSGVVELAHHLIKGFDQSHTFRYTPLQWPSLWLRFANYLQALYFRFIEDGGTERRIKDFGGPITWYESASSRFRARDSLLRIAGNDPRNKIMNEMESLLKELISAPEDKRLSPQEIEGKVEPLLEKLATFEIKRLLDLFPVERDIWDLDFRGIRKEFDITLVGPTPTVYARRQNPLNWYLLRFLEPHFKYRPAEFRRMVSQKTALLYCKDTMAEEEFEFSRIVMRGGFDKDCLGYTSKFGAKLPRSQYAANDDRLFWRRDIEIEEQARINKRRNDSLQTFFRTNKWRRIARCTIPFDDDNWNEYVAERAPSAIKRRFLSETFMRDIDPGITMLKHPIPEMEDRVDDLLFELSSLPASAEAVRLYRKFKNSSNQQKKTYYYRGLEALAAASKAR